MKPKLDAAHNTKFWREERNLLICQTTFEIFKFGKWPHPVRAKTKMDFHVSQSSHVNGSNKMVLMALQIVTTQWLHLSSVLRKLQMFCKPSPYPFLFIGLWCMVQRCMGLNQQKRGKILQENCLFFYKTTTDLQVQIWFVSSLHRAEYFFEICQPKST